MSDERLSDRDLVLGASKELLASLERIRAIADFLESDGIYPTRGVAIRRELASISWAAGVVAGIAMRVVPEADE